MFAMPIVILSMAEGEDRNFMEQLYHAHDCLMFFVARQQLERAEDVSESVSRACLSLMGKIPLLRTMEPHRRAAYVAATVHNACLDLLMERSRRESHSVAFDEAHPEPASNAVSVERKFELEAQLDCVIRAIDRLPEKERQVMRMKYLLELDDEEIARRVGLSVSSLRKYISRARVRLRAMLAEEWGEP